MVVVVIVAILIIIIIAIMINIIIINIIMIIIKKICLGDKMVVEKVAFGLTRLSSLGKKNQQQLIVILVFSWWI